MNDSINMTIAKSYKLWRWILENDIGIIMWMLIRSDCVRRGFRLTLMDGNWSHYKGNEFKYFGYTYINHGSKD